jgi:hypothetical protein
VLRRHLRTLAALTAAAAILGPLAFLWWTSRIPDTYSAMEMGHVDLGGGPGTTDTPTWRTHRTPSTSAR